MIHWSHCLHKVKDTVSDEKLYLSCFSVILKFPLAPTRSAAVYSPKSQVVVLVRSRILESFYAGSRNHSAFLNPHT